MKFAAFFRNLNLGRPPAPDRTTFEGAFLAAGATTAASFLTNGTLVFEAATPVKAKKVLAAACAQLEAASQFGEPAFLRPLDYLAGLVRRDPFADVDPATVYERCITFLDARFALADGLPMASAKQDVRAIEYTAGEMLSVSLKMGSSPGSPNAFAERSFGLPASTRAWNTVCRLVKKHA
ncbi:MAG: DUF1697 domain-containing protein [Massilia sp.]